MRPLSADDQFRTTREWHARESLLRRGIDPDQAAAESPAFRALFHRYVAERRPSVQFRRMVRSLLLAGFGPFPLRYLRTVDYREASGFVARPWQRKFDQRFFDFWSWAERVTPLPPLEEFVSELEALRNYQRRH